MNEVYLSPKAENDLKEIKTYIAEELENPRAALVTVGRITKSLRILQTHAFAGAPLSSVANREKLVVKNEVFYAKSDSAKCRVTLSLSSALFLFQRSL